MHSDQTVAILHYSAPPGIGGVEGTMLQHARCLSRLGMRVRFVAGAGQDFQEGPAVIPCHIIPMMSSSHEAILAAKAGLDQGRVPADFDALMRALTTALAAALQDADVIIVHNVCTQHKNLMLTQALHALSQGPLAGKKWIGWHHDFAWTAEQYAGELHQGQPWSLLTIPWPGLTHVVVSEARRTQLGFLFGISAEAIHVVPPGIDIQQLLALTPNAALVADKVAQADVVLLMPARITRRKNIEFALRALAGLRAASGRDVQLVISGPPGPHNPSNLAYLGRLLALRQTLGLVNAAHFLYQDFDESLSDADIGALYRLCDIMFLPSLDEGFGMPVLEALAAGRLMATSDLAPLKASGQAAGVYFDPTGDPDQAAAAIRRLVEARPEIVRRRQVLREYDWPRLVAERMLPLLG